MENPLILQPILAELPLEPPMVIGNPFSFSHNIHITYNKETGKFEVRQEKRKREL
jgi:hypothetical protein